MEGGSVALGVLWLLPVQGQPVLDVTPMSLRGASQGLS